MMTVKGVEARRARSIEYLSLVQEGSRFGPGLDRDEMAR
jgi:hypothetical protein